MGLPDDVEGRPTGMFTALTLTESLTLHARPIKTTKRMSEHITPEITLTPKPRISRGSEQPLYPSHNYQQSIEYIVGVAPIFAYFSLLSCLPTKTSADNEHRPSPVETGSSVVVVQTGNECAYQAMVTVSLACGISGGCGLVSLVQ